MRICEIVKRPYAKKETKVFEAPLCSISSTAATKHAIAKLIRVRLGLGLG